MAAVEEMDVPLRVLPAAPGPDLKIEERFCRKLTFLDLSQELEDYHRPEPMSDHQNDSGFPPLNQLASALWPKRFEWKARGTRSVVDT
jgi:hypothetical protein